MTIFVEISHLGLLVLEVKCITPGLRAWSWEGKTIAIVSLPSLTISITFFFLSGYSWTSRSPNSICDSFEWLHAVSFISSESMFLALLREVRSVQQWQINSFFSPSPIASVNLVIHGASLTLFDGQEFTLHDWAWWTFPSLKVCYWS